MTKQLSEQDEEFLEDISSLSEEKKNGIIAYIQNKLDAQKEDVAAAVKELKEQILADMTLCEAMMKKHPETKQHGAGRKLGLVASLHYLNGVFGEVGK